MTSYPYDDTPLREFLREHLTIQVEPRSNDPEDDGHQVALYLGDDRISAATLPSGS